jgi:LysM repeat protein
MSDSNPLIPQGSLLEEQAKSRPHLRIALCIVAVHMVFLGGLLMQGCKRDEADDTTQLVLPPRPPETNYPGLPTFDSGTQPFDQQRLITNEPPAETMVDTGDDLPLMDAPLGIGDNLLPVVPDARESSPLPMDFTEPDVSEQPRVGQLPPVVGGSAGVTEHKVQQGEYFITIAKRYKVTVADIAKANPGVDSTRLPLGQVLKIPAVSSDSGAAVAEPPAAAPTTGTYLVKKGDNLHRIARSHGTTVDELKRLNGLTTDRIIINQKLKVPNTGAN